MMSPVGKVGFRMIWRTQAGTTIMTNLRRERGAKFMTVKTTQVEGDNVKEDKVTGITVTSSGVTIPEVQEGVQEQDVQLGSYMEPFRRAMMSSKTMPQ